MDYDIMTGLRASKACRYFDRRVKMANIKSSKKRILVSRRQRKRNMSVRSAVKTAFKKASLAAEEDLNLAQALASVAASKIDKAVAKGILHKNKASRQKSRLARKLNAIAASSEKKG